jgi:hypothetical protein
MATHTTIAHRVLAVGGFAVAMSAAPLVAALTSPAGPASPAMATCPPTEFSDPVSGACKPLTTVSEPTFNPVDPGITGLQPGSVTSGQAGEVGRLPEVNGIPCNGGNTGLCIGLEQENAAKAATPQNPSGLQG